MPAQQTKPKYFLYYDKIVACEDAVSELYDRERDLLKQKLDNVLEYYNDLDSYMSSIVSKMDSFISLMDDMGKRSSLTDLLEQFAAADGLPNGWNYIFKKILTLSYTYGDWSL